MTGWEFFCHFAVIVLAIVAADYVLRYLKKDGGITGG